MHEREYGTTGSYGNGYGTLPAVTTEIILMAATVTLEDLTSADLTLEDSETSRLLRSVSAETIRRDQ